MILAVCQIGCSNCADKTAKCLACKPGFTGDQTDKSKCSQLPAVTSRGIQCPDGSYNAGQECANCSPSCQTCNGPSSNSCILCPIGTALLNGNCVTPDPNGICEGPGGMIADNNKRECDGENYILLIRRGRKLIFFSLRGQMHGMRNSQL
jgi:hypothetical protein